MKSHSPSKAASFWWWVAGTSPALTKGRGAKPSALGTRCPASPGISPSARARRPSGIPESHSERVRSSPLMRLWNSSLGIRETRAGCIAAIAVSRAPGPAISAAAIRMRIERQVLRWMALATTGSKSRSASSIRTPRESVWTTRSNQSRPTARAASERSRVSGSKMRNPMRTCERAASMRSSSAG